MRTRLLLALLFVATAAPVAAQVRYTVAVEDPSTRTFRVTADLPAAGEATVVSLPAWTPGHYTIEDYARYVSGFAATDPAGAALDWEKTDKDTWRIASAGADRVVVAFDFRAEQIGLSGSYLRDDFGVFTGTNLFVYPETGLDFESTVEFDLPEGWRIATGLERTGEGRYAAPDYDTLVDAPTFVGHFGIDSVAVDGVPIRFAVYPAEQLSTGFGSASLDAIGKIAGYMHDLWGGVPYDGYTVLLYLADEDLSSFGGLEHANSHFDILPLALADGERPPFVDYLYSHEYVHAWNVKRIRPVQMWPYDYAAEQYTPLLWVSEGITDYYGVLTLARTGLWSAEQTWGDLAQAAVNVAGEPPTAVEDSSLETWLDPIDVPSNYYYSKGKLLGLLLDVLIRDATDGAVSLDDVMRRLYEERYEAGRGFTTGDVLDFIDDHVDPATVRGFYENYVDGREPLPLAEVLAKVGLVYRVETAELPFLGVGMQPDEEGELVVASVSPESAAETAGVKPGDRLVEVGGISIEDEPDWGETFRERYSGKTGEPLTVVVLRDGEELTLETTVRTRERTDTMLEVDPDAGERAARLREGLLAR